MRLNSKMVLAGGVLIAGMLGTSASASAARVTAGDTAKPITLQATDETTFELAALHGEKIAVLVFFRGAW
jgi:cytochrome oxidase Cu insertion factor (SCO1/SenC/PrrC family)